jgi:hypothetical protein
MGDLYPELRRCDRRRFLEALCLVALAEQLPGPRCVDVVLLADGGPWGWRLSPSMLAENAARTRARLAEIGISDLPTGAHAMMRMLTTGGSAPAGLSVCATEVILAFVWESIQKKIRKIIDETERDAFVLILRPRRPSFDIDIRSCPGRRVPPQSSPERDGQ